MLKDALNDIAERARPVDGIAEQALRAATRRRRFIGTGVAVGAVAAIAAPVAFFTQASAPDGDATTRTRIVADGSDPATGEGLPADTTAGRAAVKACMNGDPAMPPEFRDDAKRRQGSAPNEAGTRARDFRLLAEHRVPTGRIVFLGSSLAHRTCVLDRSGRASQLDRLPRQTANRWQFDIGYGLRNIKGPVSIQDAGGGLIAYGTAPYELHVAGLVRPEVARLVIRFGRERPVTATISNGFFVGGMVVPFETGTTLIEKSVDVTAYNRAGKVVFTHRRPGVPPGTSG
ncbi:hypothetical protein GCM10009780_78050 [Actinomadura alba]